MVQQGPFGESTQQLPFGHFTQQLPFGQYTAQPQQQSQPYEYESTQYLYPSPPIQPQAQVEQQPIAPDSCSTQGGPYPYGLHLEEFGTMPQQFMPHNPEGHHQIWTGQMHGSTDALPQAATPDQFGMTPFQHTGMIASEATLMSPTDKAPAFFRVDESNGTAKLIAKTRGTRRRLDGGSSIQNTARGEETGGKPKFSTVQNPIVFDVSTPETFYAGNPAVANVVHDTMREHGYCK